MSIRNLPSWRARAACRGADITEFFGPEGERAEDREAREERVKREYCRPCPVRTDCLLDAYDGSRRGGHAKTGVWGGTGEDERSTLRRSYLRHTVKERRAARETA
ncbi:WhiB family transcriptional regulator [Actinomadura yumaensis]|uniref:WhiB family transcriptional regulator n=1 Tax=Actinomadura yumaensis TaxID=111807 RepID=A0ABW2CRE3_9ACTN